MVDSHNLIFPTGSPIKQLDSEDQVEPMPMSHSEHDDYSSKLLCRLHPLLQARMEADKVYSNGYFERHYSKADKKLKRLLHDRVIAAWANALNDADPEERPKAGLGSGITIQINLGK